MSDAIGSLQFLSAMGEIAHGARKPFILPVWERDVLNARDPPRPTFIHREYEEVEDTKGAVISLTDMTQQSFFFGPSEISALRSHVPPYLKHYSTFKLLTTCLWKYRRISIQPDSGEKMRLVCLVNARTKFNPPLPNGYYGNVFALPAVVTTAGELSRNTLGYALELVKEAKNIVTEEYMRSVADLMVIKGSFYMPFSNKKGEKGIVLPICLPQPAMDKFVKELNTMLKGQSET